MQGNVAYREESTLLTPELRPNILEVLVQEIVQYKVYVSDKQWNAFGQALIS